MEEKENVQFEVENDETSKNETVEAKKKNDKNEDSIKLEELRKSLTNLQDSQISLMNKISLLENEKKNQNEEITKLRELNIQLETKAKDLKKILEYNAKKPLKEIEFLKEEIKKISDENKKVKDWCQSRTLLLYGIWEQFRRNEKDNIEKISEMAMEIKLFKELKKGLEDNAKLNLEKILNQNEELKKITELNHILKENESQFRTQILDFESERNIHREEYQKLLKINSSLKENNDKLNKKLSNPAPPQSNPSNEEDSNICTICTFRHIEYQTGCGHVYCGICLSKITLCAFCREEIASVIPFR